MIEIYQDGKLKWTIESIGSPSDIVFLPKSMANECSMSASGFDNIFYACMSGSKTNVEAYEKAEQIHVQYFEKRKYSSYESFAVSKSKRHNERG